jgi:hypothetical protein
MLPTIDLPRSLLQDRYMVSAMEPAGTPIDMAMLTRLDSVIRTRFGWTLHVGAYADPRSLRNHPVQANGAEMMRVALYLATERGVSFSKTPTGAPWPRSSAATRRPATTLAGSRIIAFGARRDWAPAGRQGHASGSTRPRGSNGRRNLQPSPSVRKNPTPGLMRPTPWRRALGDGVALQRAA